MKDKFEMIVFIVCVLFICAAFVYLAFDVSLLIGIASICFLIVAFLIIKS